MTSRVRGGSAVKEGSKTIYSKDHFHGDTEERVPKSYKNGSRDNRYHFGMPRHEETSKNGRECKEETDEDPDLLYRRSKRHFGAWDLKDIVHGENGRSSRKPNDRFDDPRSTLTNGQSKTEITRLENSRQDRRDDGHLGSLTWEEDRGRTGSMDREQSDGHRSSRKKESWENSEGKLSSRSTRSRNNGNKEDADERDLLLREIENLTVDGRSPDRRIRAMIERFKTRDEDKSKSRREQSSFSPERIEEYRSRGGGGRNDPRVDHASDDRINDRPDRGRVVVVQRDEEERRSARSRIRESEKLQREEPIRDGPSRSIDRRSRSTEKYSDTVLPMKEEKSKRCESFRQKNEAHNADRNYRRKSREIEDDQSRTRDSSRRRSYVYDGNPEDFDVRIQRYERALPEPRKDPESSRRVSPKDSDPDLPRKESFKNRDRQVTRKSSFKVSDGKKSSGRDRETSLNRKTSFKDQENDLYRKNSFKGQPDGNKRYFGKDQENDLSRKNSSKEHDPDVGRKNSFKEQNTADYGRITFKNRENEAERKNSFKGHVGGVSRISFKDHEDELPRINCFKDPEVEIRRVPFKDPGNDLGRRNSPKTVEFAGISFEDDGDDREDAEKRNSHPDRDNEFAKSSTFRGYGEPERKGSPNGRYVDFGKVSFKTQDEASRGSPSREQDHELEGKSSPKERDSSKRRVSLRSKAREAFDKRSDRHSRPLTPPKKRDEIEDREEFCVRSWHESNKVFAARYLRDNARHRVNPEGRSAIERDPSPETMIAVQEFHDTKYMNEGFGADDVEDVKRDQQRRKPDSTTGNQTSGAPASLLDSRYASTRERNGATIIRIRSSPENPVERRRRRRPAQDAHAGRRRRYAGDEEAEEEEEEEEQQLGEDEDEGEEVAEVEEDSDDDDDNENDHRLRSRRDGFVPRRGVPTPSRRVWNYREGGVLITDVEEGQPCLQCGETCPGFLPHVWRKNCTSCKCPREAHDVCHEEWVSVRSRLGLKGEESSPPIGFDPREKGLAWAPPGLPAHKVEEYFSMLPEISVPRLGTPGERHRDRQLAIQLPKQDLARAYCRHLNPKHASSADDFMAARNEIALDIGSVQEALERDLDCGACNTPLKYGSLAISAGKLGLLYHPSCFRCADCKELLVDLAYCVHDDVLFCERHYAEQLKPRCAACDELIFSGEYTKAMNKDWHSGHFCCWQCDESLTGQRYVLRDEHPYCIKCYESVFANGCEECNKIIGIDSKDLSYKDKHWHEACFLCNRCRVSLVDKQFGSKVDKIYCGNCYDAQFASRCDGCGEIFRAGTKKMEYKTRQWHEKCFCCVVCKNPIGTKSFIPREQEIYCGGCYEDKFATRCVKCNKIITSGGVTYKNEPWHRDCFTCSNCNNSLAGQRFTSRDDKPYCADCFGELFAKRCTACSKPITGIGGTRFISFEDRHWHNDCFICAGCKTSLVGRGFITDGEDIICPECAKMKLM